MPVVSIVIPVYGAESYLPRCLDSVLAQTFTDWECILVEDGSPDDSAAICDSYAEKDSRFRVFHQENQGMGFALDNGIARAKGEYLVTLDNDDMISPVHLETAVRLQRQNPNCMIMWHYTNDADQLCVPGEEITLKSFCRNQTARLFLDDMMFYRWNKLLSLDFIRKIGLRTHNIHYAQDTIFIMQYASHWFREHLDARYLLMDNNLYYHEIGNENQITAGYGKTYCYDMMEQMAFSCDWFSHEFPTDLETKIELHHFYLRILPGCFWAEKQHHGVASAASYMRGETAQRIARNARALGIECPFIRLILNGHIRTCCALGKLVLFHHPHYYADIVRYGKKLHYC